MTSDEYEQIAEAVREAILEGFDQAQATEQTATVEEASEQLAELREQTETLREEVAELKEGQTTETAIRGYQ